MNKTIEQKFSVPFHYRIFFTENSLSRENELLADLLSKGKICRAFFVVDEGVVKAQPDILEKIHKYSAAHSDKYMLCGEPLVVPGGEQSKNDQKWLTAILDATNEYGIDRHSFIVAVGGGAVLDMAGFAAAVAHRGIRHIRIPSTVLSQNDSGIGVKNSINAYGKKNYLGTFSPPYAVINDKNLLNTLSDRDWRSGISEAIKVALIKDSDFFEWLEKNALDLASRNMAVMETLIYRCAALHLEHIAGGDPFEAGSSRPLDFGHWSAHKLEQLSDYELRHGEAVAIGIALDSTYSFLQGMLNEEQLQRIIKLMHTLGFYLYSSELSGPTVLKGLEEFREHLGGELTIMLLEGIGNGKEVHKMDHEIILQSIEHLKAFQKENNSTTKK